MKPTLKILITLIVLLVSCTPSIQTGPAGNLTPSSPSTTPVATTSNTPTPTPIPLINSIAELIKLNDVLSLEEIVTEVAELDQGAILYKITYISDGYTVVGYIAAPKDYLEQQTPYPVMILNRGGNADYGALNTQVPPSIAISLKAIVFASQYRETHEGTGKDEFGGDDVHDVIKLLDFADSCSFADSDHIVMWGASRGSMMTFEVIRMDERVRAAIVTGSVPDLVAVYNFRGRSMQSILKYRVGGTPEQVPDEYERRSAIQWAQEINVPILVFHAADDLRSPIGPVDKFVSLLETLGKDVTYIRKEVGGHGYSEFDLIEAFFATHTN